MDLSNRLKIPLMPVALALLLASSALAQYTRTDLFTDTGTGGTIADPTLINGRGPVALPTSPFWVGDEGTGQSALYTGAGVEINLTVAIPAASGGQGKPTGIVGNSKHLELRGSLHSPWGVALAPADFGPLSNASNIIPRGRIEAFDPNSGSYLGFLCEQGKAIEVDEIWAIQFAHGIFGVIAPD